MMILKKAHLQVRLAICDRCPTKCGPRLKGGLNVADAAASCPATPPRWSAHTRDAVSIGLGDVVHAIAHPFAVVVDAVAGTDLKNCPGCRKRRKDCNRAWPDITRPPAHRPQPRHGG